MGIRSNKGFYIGDICYVLGDDVYHNFWGDQKNYSDGAFEVPGAKLSFAVASTAYGDGLYCDDEGNEYPVDAGVLGIVPLELIGKEDGLDCGRIINTPGTAGMTSYGGVFDFFLPDGRIVHIDTAMDEEED